MHRIDATFGVPRMKLSDKYCCHCLEPLEIDHSICGSVDLGQAREVFLQEKNSRAGRFLSFHWSNCHADHL